MEFVVTLFVMTGTLVLSVTSGLALAWILLFGILSVVDRGRASGRS